MFCDQQKGGPQCANNNITKNCLFLGIQYVRKLKRIVVGKNQSSLQSFDNVKKWMTAEYCTI
jgi:hypothetical protein